jgi:hypothetical protein
MFLAPLSLLLAATAPLAVQPPRPLETPSTAEACGRCHRAIQEAWQASAHSRAMTSRLFQDGLELAENDFGPDARAVCLGCHAPIAARIGDMRLHRKVSWEGVTCDYCHSMLEVSLDEANPRARVEFSLVKTGPLREASSNGHKTAYSSVHTTSAVCAPCHQYENALAFPVLTTFEEWRKSRYAREGKNCQTCHMHVVAGDVVDPLIQSVPLAKINLHLMPGSHSIDQLASTVRATLSTARLGNKLQVVLNVANANAGHYVPTGSPMRQIVVEVRADSYEGQHFKEQRVYRRVVAGQDGKEIDREPTAFLRGAKTLSDTRLAPDEKRKEVFLFPIPAKTSAQVTATFWYYYSPLARTEAQKRVTFLSVQQLVK